MTRKQIIIKYSDLLSYTNIFEGGKIKKHHGITRAITGGIIAGPVGALIGAGTGGKEFTSITRLGVMIHMQNNKSFQYLFIESETKTDSFIGKGLTDSYNRLIGKLDQIISLNNTTNSINSAFSTTEEIRNYKQLLDDGIITPTEFEMKKKDLLNL